MSNKITEFALKNTRLVRAAFCGILLSPWLSFGQGSLTPPGPPAPMMRTLDQIEPRIPISSLPFVISNSGSYFLTTNVVGAPGQHGIIISNDNVTLDLRGFAVIGVSGFVSGIYVPNAQQNISVRNGFLRGWYVGLEGQYTSDCQYSDLNVSGNAEGFDLGTHDTVVNCIAHNNYYHGFLLGQANTVIGCSARSNVFDGFIIGSGSQILNSFAGANGAIGFGVGDNCTVKDCLAISNGSQGIQAGSGCRLVENTCNSNAIGINVAGRGNRVDSNLAISNSIAGIQVAATNCNVIVRNQALANKASYGDFVGLNGNVSGNVLTCYGSVVLTNGSGWENFNSPVIP